MGVYQLVDFLFWEQEGVGSSPTTHTKTNNYEGKTDRKKVFVGI